MSMASIQAVLDPQGTNRKIRITKAYPIMPANTATNYFCEGGTEYPGKARWVAVTDASSDATNAAAIRAALATGP